MELIQEFIASPYEAGGLVLDWPLAFRPSSLLRLRATVAPGRGCACRGSCRFLGCQPCFSRSSRGYGCRRGSFHRGCSAPVRGGGRWFPPARGCSLPGSACGFFPGGGLLPQPVRPGDFACGGCSFCPRPARPAGPRFCNGLGRWPRKGSAWLFTAAAKGATCFRPILPVLWRQSRPSGAGRADRQFGRPAFRH